MPDSSWSYYTCRHKNTDYAETLQWATSFRWRTGERLWRTYRKFNFPHPLKQTPWRRAAKIVSKNIRTTHNTCVSSPNDTKWGTWHFQFIEPAFSEHPAAFNIREISAINTAHLQSRPPSLTSDFRKPARRVTVTINCRKLQPRTNVGYDNRVDKRGVSTQTSVSSPYVWAHDKKLKERCRRRVDCRSLPTDESFWCWRPQNSRFLPSRNLRS